MLIIAIYELDSAHESSMFEAKSLRGQNSHVGQANLIHGLA